MMLWTSKPKGSFFWALFLILLTTGSLFSSTALGSSSINPTKDPEADKLTCQYLFQKENLCFTFTWEKIPVSTSDFGQIILKTFKINSDQSATLLNPTGVPRLELWMTASNMNHGSSPTFTEALDTGVYRIKNILFSMPGEWTLRFQITKNNNVTDETEIFLTF